MKTEGLRVDFGRHKDELYTRVPVQYLRWMIGTKHTKADIAEAELKRRGTTVPDLDVSGHAIDRASFRILNKWERERRPDEGLYSWLVRIAREALDKGIRAGDIVVYSGLKLVFQMDGRWPVLKTIMKT